ARQGNLLRQARGGALRPLFPSGPTAVRSLAHRVLRHHKVIGAVPDQGEALGLRPSRGAELLGVTVVAPERTLVDLVVRIAGGAGGSPGKGQASASGRDGQWSLAGATPVGYRAGRRYEPEISYLRGRRPRAVDEITREAGSAVPASQLSRQEFGSTQVGRDIKTHHQRPGAVAVGPHEVRIRRHTGRFCVPEQTERP